MAETQPQLHPALLRFSAIISQYRFTSLPNITVVHQPQLANVETMTNDTNMANTTRFTAPIHIILCCFVEIKTSTITGMNHWEVIADRLSASGLSWGCS